MLHVSALLSHHQAYTSITTVFQFCLTVFELFVLGIPFALQIIIIVCMVLGAHCRTYLGGDFSLVNLPVVLVYGYGRGSCNFCNFEPLY